VDPVEVLARCGGAAARHDVVPHTGEYRLRRAVAAGAVVRTSRGIYALPKPMDAITAAVTVRGAVSHQSAAAQWQMEMVREPETAHVTVSRHARPAPLKGVTVHCSTLAKHEVDGAVTSPLRTVLDCAKSMEFTEALAIADSACRRQLLTAAELVDGAANLRGPGRAAAMRVAAVATGLAANPFESALRGVLLAAGLTNFVPQLEIRAGGLHGWVDLGDAAMKIACEADSFEFHGQRDKLTKDCWRYNELVGAGWLVLRFAWEQVMFERDWVVQVTRRAIAARALAHP
jgi:very-short-patch-repair endonuclease